MIDLTLINGDLNLVQTGQEVLPTFDIGLESELEAFDHLVRRTLETPLTYLSRAILEPSGLSFIDRDYGNPLYQKLSDPFSLNWLSEASKEVRAALSALDPVINLEDLSFYTSGLDTIHIKVVYTANLIKGTVLIPLT